MKPVLYLFVNKELGMSGGKIAAQTAQTASGAYLVSDEDMRSIWWNLGGHHTTYVMEARDSMHLRDIESYLQARNFKTFLMIDEGMTEVPPITPTMLGVEIVDKDDPHVAATFSIFKLYKDKDKPQAEEPAQVESSWFGVILSWLAFVVVAFIIAWLVISAMGN